MKYILLLIFISCSLVDDKIKTRVEYDTLYSYDTVYFDTLIKDRFVFYGDVMKDNDGNEYGTLVINETTWMAKNLREIQDNSYSYNNQSGTIPFIYGRLYSKNVGCPSGWRLPTSQEFKNLVEYSQGANHLKSVDLWLSPDDGDNRTGFNAVPGGFYNSEFSGLRELTGFHTQTSVFILSRNTNEVIEIESGDYYSVRCVK